MSKFVVFGESLLFLEVFSGQQSLENRQKRSPLVNRMGSFLSDFCAFPEGDASFNFRYFLNSIYIA